MDDSKIDYAKRLLTELREDGWNCAQYRRDPSVQQKEYEYHGIMLHGDPNIAKCVKVNRIINEKHTLSYIEDFEIKDNGVYFKPNTDQIKGTYALVMGNGAVYENQEYARVLLKQGYEVILHSLYHKDEPFKGETFPITTPIVGLLINAHGDIENNQHIIDFSLDYPKIKTLDTLRNLKNSYSTKIADKFELAILSCYTGAIKKDTIQEIIPNLNELYLSSKDSYTTIQSITTYSESYKMVEDSEKYNFGLDISPTSFFTQKDTAWEQMRDGHYDYYELEILGNN